MPHYVARSEFPDAALTLLDALGRATGLSFATTPLAEQAQRVRDEIDSQVSGSEEVAGVVTALEQQYDAFLSARGRGLLAGDAPLPTADELGAEFEAFLPTQLLT